MKIGDIVKVTWLDAVGEMGVSRDKLELKAIKDILVETITYGELFMLDDDGVVILPENSSMDTCDYACIPQGMIRNIERLK